VTLQQRIERMRRQAQNGVIAPGELVSLLDDLSDIIQAHEARLVGVLRTLTYTEQAVIRALLEALPGEDGGVVVTSQVADASQTSRSGLTQAIRKLEAAGLVQSRSLGTKGTLIRLLGITRTDLRQYLGGAA